MFYRRGLKWRGQNRHKEIDHLTDKIDIRKSIISWIERVTIVSVRPKIPSQNFSKLDERCHTSVAEPLGTARGQALAGVPRKRLYVDKSIKQ